MLNKIILWSSFLGPWLTLFFMKKDAIKRYMPVTVFTALMATITSEMAYTYSWWKHTDVIVAWGYITNPSFIYGLFAVLTLWIFYFTSRSFWLYLTVNIAFNAFQWFFLIRWTFVALGIFEYVNITPFQVFVMGIFQALLIYGYHKWQEGIFRREETPDSDGELDMQLPELRSKAK